MDAQIHAAFTGKLPETEQRRRSVRRASSVAAVLTPVAIDSFAMPGTSGMPARISVVLSDWSRDGAGLRVRVPLDVCTTYQVEAESDRQLLPGDLLRVVACTRGGDGWYRIGAVWCQPMQAFGRAVA